MSSYQQISVGNLLLNVSNYRIVKQTSQKAARDAIIEEQGKKLVTLAKDILENGLNPSDLLIVVDANDGDQNHIVIEGNRRLTTINLLLDPELARGHSIHSTFVKLGKESDAIPKVIYCSIAPSRKDALRWADRKHANGLGGAGTEPWTAMAKARADVDQDKPAPALDVVNFVLTNKELDSRVRRQLEGSKFNLTTLERLVTTTELQDSVGLIVDNGKVTSKNNMDWVRTVLSDVVSTIATGSRGGRKWTERDIDTQERRAMFAKDVAADPKGKKPNKRWAVSGRPKDVDGRASSATKAKKVQTTPSTADQVNLISRSFKLELPAGKINDIFTELKKLDVTTYPHAVSVLFRVFLDLSLDNYIEKQGVQLPENNGRKDDRLKVRLQKVVDHVKHSDLLSAKQLQPLRVAMSNSNSLLATETLHAYVHSRWMHPDPLELKTSWLNTQAFLEKIWTTK
jgi:hypothetical protein